MRVPALPLLLVATVAVSAVLAPITLGPFVGFAKRKLAERDNRIKFEILGTAVRSEKDRRMVISASNRLREMFNEGACEPIYTDAADSFRLGPESQWTLRCEQLRRQLGEWQSFEVRQTIHCSTEGSQICIKGLASFANGSYPFQVAWSLVRAEPALYALFVGDPKALILRWEPFLFEPKPELIAGPM